VDVVFLDAAPDGKLQLVVPASDFVGIGRVQPRFCRRFRWRFRLIAPDGSKIFFNLNILHYLLRKPCLLVLISINVIQYVANILFNYFFSFNKMPLSIAI